LYRLHETMREYAGLKLREAGEEEVVELRCADYYLSRCQRSAAPARYGLVEWLDWIELEIDNIRSILHRCLMQADFSRGIELASSLRWYWTTRATTEGVRWLEELLASEGGNTDAHAQAYFTRGFLAVLQSDPTAARPALKRAVAAAREARQLGLLSESLSMASMAENMAGDRAIAKRFLDETELITAGLDDLPPTLMFLDARAFNGLCEGNPGAVRSASSQGARLSRDVGDLYSLRTMLMNLGFAALIEGDFDESKPLYAEALRIAHQIDHRVAQSYLVGGLACAAAASGEPRLAARLLGAAETMRTEAGANVIGFFAPFLTQARESAIAVLGASKFEAELSAGKGMSRSAAVDLALGESTRSAAMASDDPGRGLLGKREAEVAQLVAEGLSNKQIGARLFISERTVGTHVRSILNKLGFNSRAQIAGWMASND
jgi:DNA-binding CsgD family transcriptional regulator